MRLNITETRCKKALEHHSCKDLVEALHHIADTGSKLKYTVEEIEMKFKELDLKN